MSDGGWKIYVDQASGKPYYYNPTSQKTQWSKPRSMTKETLQKEKKLPLKSKGAQKASGSQEHEAPELAAELPASGAVASHSSLECLFSEDARITVKSRWADVFDIIKQSGEFRTMPPLQQLTRWMDWVEKECRVHITALEEAEN